MTIDDCLKVLMEKGGSDLHLRVGRPPIMRIDGNPIMMDFPPLTQGALETLIVPMLTDNQKLILRNRKAVDFTYDFQGTIQLRCSLFYQEGMLGAVMKMAPECMAAGKASLGKAAVTGKTEPNLNFFLRELIKRGGSDLHLKAGRPPLFRIRGDLLPTEFPVVGRKDMEDLLLPILNGVQRDRLEKERELDFSYLIEGLGRFRGNYFYQMDKLGGVFRFIPIKIATLDDLGLPEVLKEILSREQGLILVTGPTGSGKSTTLAAMVDYLNNRTDKHIVTIEDPIEFIHEDKKCVINQREVGNDTRSFSEALRHALRQDPDIILVGEMRDPETIHTALTASETGHIVLSTLHTTYAKQSISRIIDAFDPSQQNHIRIRTAISLIATISQKLIKKSDGSGRTAAMEIMLNTPTVKKLIIEEKLDHLDKTIEDSAKLYKMQTFNQHLFEFVKTGILTKEDALSTSYNPNDLRIMFQTQSMGEKLEDLKKTHRPAWIKENKS
ncbi:MAG TPA: type IV pilus twitching motility protein PilT [Dissulfurispiraceae bacterium]|nr:type IV pilus twitching motility protein PilT [Dissulfurispiraceae bacterium]